MQSKANWIKSAKLLLGILILIQLIRIGYVFVYQREGYHSDENWSYGYANSFYAPNIYMDTAGQISNFNQWISGQLLRDYIMVNPGEAFRFDSVFFNQQKDLSPPLHSMLLHAVCSLFPGTFSWYYSFAINIVFFVLTLIALYFLGLSLTDSRSVSLLACLFYGFTAGALNCFIYLRMYGMLTCLAVVSALLHSRLYRRGFQNAGRELVALVIVTIAGALTHYYFYILSFFLAALFCLLLLARRQWRSLATYAGSMLLAVAAALALFPFSLRQLAGGTSVYPNQMPYGWNLQTTLYLLIRETTGIQLVHPVSVMLAYAAAPALVLLVLTAAAAFLLRREPWFRSLLVGIRHWPGQFGAFVRDRLWKEARMSILLLLAILATLAVIARISNVLNMGVFTDRYIFFLMPLACVLLIQGLTSLFRWQGTHLAWRHLLPVALVIAMLVLNNAFAEDHYLFRRQTQGEPIEQLTSDADCILVTSDAWRLTYYASVLKDVHLLYAVQVSDIMESQPARLTEGSERPLYVLIETSMFLDEQRRLRGNKMRQISPGVKFGAGVTVDEYLMHLSSLLENDHSKLVSSQNSFNGVLELYRLN